MNETPVETVETNGNFEQEYTETCKKMSIKPLHLLKFGTIPPPLPVKAVDLIAPAAGTSKSSAHSLPQSRAQSGGRKKSTMIDDIPLLSEVPKSLGQPTRKVVNERREISIQEFLKKGQIDFGSVCNILSGSSWPKNETPYQSRYKYTPTISMETAEVEEGEEEFIYKIQMRGFKLDLGTFEVLNTIITNLPNLVHIK
jgi:hypothetical protein